MNEVPAVGASEPVASNPERPVEGPISRAGLVTGVAGVLLIVGSFLPWVTIGSILSINGVSARWGLFTLFAGLALVGIAVQLATGRLVARTRLRPLAMAGVALGVMSLGVALYVGLALRDAIAESETGASSNTSTETGTDDLDDALDDFSKSLEEFFKVGTGIGVYTAAAGGLLGAVGAGLGLRRNEHE